MEGSEDIHMPKVVGVRFKSAGKIYYFDPQEYQDLTVGEWVVVETSRGDEMGRVVISPCEIDEEEITGQLKPVKRRATPADRLSKQRYEHKEAEALQKCREKVAEYGLPMKVVGAEYNFDGSRLVFFFTSDTRVDFRDLVRELAKIFHTRIELRQVGVRDEARLIGGLGRCGYPLCCSTWLCELTPVSIKMAKQQDLPLSPMEISGLCGRLLCCLAYENDLYVEVKARLPKVGTQIETPHGPGKVMGVNVLKESVTVELENGVAIEISAEELREMQERRKRSSRGDSDSRRRRRGKSKRRKST